MEIYVNILKIEQMIYLEQIHSKLSNLKLYVISIFLFSIFFFIGAENVIYFSVFSPKHSKFPSNYFTNSLIIKS